MTPFKFAAANTVIAKQQPQYVPLPAHVSPGGLVTCCFELSVAELNVLIRTRQLWVQVITGNTPLQPLRLSVELPPMHREAHEPE